MIPFQATPQCLLCEVRIILIKWVSLWLLNVEVSIVIVSVEHHPRTIAQNRRVRLETCCKSRGLLPNSEVIGFKSGGIVSYPAPYSSLVIVYMFVEVYPSTLFQYMNHLRRNHNKSALSAVCFLFSTRVRILYNKLHK